VARQAASLGRASGLRAPRRDAGGAAVEAGGRDGRQSAECEQRGVHDKAVELVVVVGGGRG